MAAANLRGQVIANNIANLETPGYRRRDVRFEELLAEALGSDERADATAVRAEIFCPGGPADATGNDVCLEREIGQLIQNGEKHKAYVRVLAKIYQQLDLAMGGAAGA